MKSDPIAVLENFLFSSNKGGFTYEETSNSTDTFWNACGGKRDACFCCRVQFSGNPDGGNPGSCTGKEGWIHIYLTPFTPKIVRVQEKYGTVKVTYTKCANATGYDVVIGRKAGYVHGEYRPLDYGKMVQKAYKGSTVTVTFTNVPSGKYYVGLHAYNRTSADKKKVFSPWSEAKRI